MVPKELDSKMGASPNNTSLDLVTEAELFEGADIATNHKLQANPLLLKAFQPFKSAPPNEHVLGK